MKQKKVVLVGIVSALAGCDRVDIPDRLDGNPTPVPPSGTDSATESGLDDSDSGTDTSVDSDSVDTETGMDTDSLIDTDYIVPSTDDTGGCSGVTCYEKVAAPRDLISVADHPDGAFFPVADRIVPVTFSLGYSAVPSYVLVDIHGRERAAGDIPAATGQVDFVTVNLALPVQLPPGRYALRLFGTSLDNVRTYRTYPSRQYIVEIV